MRGSFAACDYAKQPRRAPLTGRNRHSDVDFVLAMLQKNQGMLTPSGFCGVESVLELMQR